jgi:manganese transport protein
MGIFANTPLVKVGAWLVASIIVILNANLVIETVSGWIRDAENPALLYCTVVPLVMAAGFLLLYITLSPVIKKVKRIRSHVPDGAVETLNIFSGIKYHRIAVSVDFSTSDNKAISNAIAQGGKDAEYILIHIVETAGARMMGSEIDDLETLTDKVNLEKYKIDLESKGFKIQTQLGFGNPKKSIPEIVNTVNCDLLVMGAHGHRAFKDIIFGTTLDAVRHNVKVPVLIVK